MRQKGRALKLARDFRNGNLTRNMDLPSLALQAQQEANAQPGAERETPAASARLVRTPLDEQVAEHERIAAEQKMGKAVGAEVTDLDIDLAQLRKPTDAIRENLFDGELENPFDDDQFEDVQSANSQEPDA